MGVQTKPPAYVNLDSWLVLIGGTNYGAGTGTRFGVGQGNGAWAGWTNRFAIAIPRGTLFDGIPNAAAITAFDIKLRVSNSCYGIGSAVKFWLERGTTAFIETAYGEACGVATTGNASGRYPGSTRETANRVKYEGTPANNDWITVSMLALGQWWFDHPEVTSLVLVGIAADATTGYEEASTTRRAMFYSRETSSVPYAELKWNDNAAPNIPIDLLPAADTKIASTAGTSATVSSRHTDPEGNAASKYQAQWYPSSATDATPGTPTKDDTITATTAHNAVRSHTFTGLPARTAGKWRMRFYDGQWGPWGLLQANTTAYQPSAVNPATEPGTKTPRFYDSITSGDGADFATAWQDVVYQDTPQGTITKWDSGKQAIGGSPTRVERTYSGSAIEWGTPYRRRRRLWNRDDVPTTADSAWPTSAADIAFTQSEPTGAVLRFNSAAGALFDVATKIDTLTPTINLTDPSLANIDQGRLWLENEAATVIYDSGVVSFTAAASRNFVIPANVLAWGMNPKAYGAVRLSGNANIGPTSEKKVGHVNASPGSPYPLSAYHASAQFVLRPDGVYVVDTAQPTIVLPHRDTDRDLGYVDNPTRREIELRSTADAHVGASPYVITTGITNEWIIPAAILVAETTYKTRGSYDDSAAVRSAFSEYLFVKRSAVPTLSSVTPAAAATITDPSPPFAWVYAHTGGLPQSGYRLVAKVGQTTVYDSGLVPGTAATHTIPIVNGVSPLPNGASVDWTLTVYNTDGLYATIARTFTTNFTQPPAITGLVVTPDLDTKSLIVSWTASTLSDDEHEAYYVYAKPEGGAFRLVATITDKAGTSIYYRAAAHNREEIIRVTQTNGWAESAPAEASATLGGEEGFIDGYWDVGLDGAFVIEHVSDHGGDTPTDIEQFAPPGREDKILLTRATTGYEGSFRLFSADHDLIDRLRAYKKAGTVRLFKTYSGASRYVRYTSTPDGDLQAGYVSAQISYIEISGEGAGF